LRYVRAREYAEFETRTYREYVAESIRIYGENKRITTRWIDVIRKQKEDTRTGDEIAADVVSRLGLIYGGDVQ